MSATSSSEERQEVNRTWFVFLRGINVGGVKVPMARLREVLLDAGARDVRTWLATGNVRLVHPDAPDAGDAAALGALVEQVISKAFGYEAHVVVRTPEQVRDAVAAWPFEADETCHRYLVLGGATAWPAVREVMSGSPQERAEPWGDDLHWRCPKGSTTTSRVSVVLGRRPWRTGVTTRNLATLEKMLQG